MEDRRRALRKGEMANDFRDKLTKSEWTAYYQKLNEAQYNPDFFNDKDRAYMYLGGNKITIEMQKNGEFSIISMEATDNAKAITSNTEKDAGNGVSSERYRNSDRDSRNGEESRKDGGESRKSVREEADAAGDGDSSPTSYSRGIGNKPVRFSMKSPVEETGRFIAVHNMGEESLRGMMEIGGLAMPSIALTRADAGHNTYGDVSVVFGKDSVNPTDRRNRIFSGDAYTPSFPEVGYKINEKVSREARQKVNTLLDEAGVPKGELRPSLDSDNGQDMIRRWGSFAKAYKNDDGMKIGYAKKYLGTNAEMWDKIKEAKTGRLISPKNQLPSEVSHNKGNLSSTKKDNQDTRFSTKPQNPVDIAKNTKVNDAGDDGDINKKSPPAEGTAGGRLLL